MTNVPRELIKRSIALAIIAVAQFANVSFAQGSEYIEVIALSDLDFGVVAKGSGNVSVDKTYPYVGMFKVQAALALPAGILPEVDLTFVPPHALDGSEHSIPYSMDASTNSNDDNPIASTATNGTTAQITLERDEGSENGLPVYSAYVYVFGSIDVGSVSSGDYAGSLTLNAEVVSAQPPACLADTWDRRTRYHDGDIVTHDGAAWEADRFTIGNEPGNAHDWHDDDGDGDEGHGRGNSNTGDDENDSQGDPGGGRPWDLVTICQ